MKHPLIRLLVVTGGGGVVKAAMASGKRAIAAGPGNPPVVVDETADIQAAGRDIVFGASLDNNIICIVEKEIIVVNEVADALKRTMEANHAVELRGRDIKKLEKLLITDDNHVNRDYIGKDAALILADAGIRVPDSTRLAFAEVEESHPFVQHEMLMPVVGLVRAPTVDEAIDCAVRVEHGYGHTAVMHSTNIRALSRMARAVNTSIFVKNAPSAAGTGLNGEGFTSWTIASPTGEGMTYARHFARARRCVLKDTFEFAECLMKRLELDITNDAVAIAEFSTMPAGLIATDAATKESEVVVLFSGTIHPGKFLLALDGGVSETELALKAATQAGRSALIDSVHLPFPHPYLRALQTPTLDTSELSLLAVETLTVPSLLGALDRTLKSTRVTLRLMQLADHLGGKSLAVLEGDLPDIESAFGYLNTDISSLLLSDLQLIRRPSRQFTESFLNSLR